MVLVGSITSLPVPTPASPSVRVPLWMSSDPSLSSMSSQLVMRETLVPSVPDQTMRSMASVPPSSGMNLSSSWLSPVRVARSSPGPMRSEPIVPPVQSTTSSPAPPETEFAMLPPLISA